MLPRIGFVLLRTETLCPDERLLGCRELPSPSTAENYAPSLPLRTSGFSAVGRCCCNLIINTAQGFNAFSDKPLFQAFQQCYDIFTTLIRSFRYVHCPHICSLGLTTQICYTLIPILQMEMGTFWLHNINVILSFIQSHGRSICLIAVSSFDLQVYIQDEQATQRYRTVMAAKTKNRK